MSLKHTITTTALIATFFIAPFAHAQEQRFTDVPVDHLYYKPIEYFAALGAIEGYKDANNKLSFKPNQKVNRAEAIKMILSTSSKTRTLEKAIAKDVFPDVKAKEWYAPFVKKAKEEGIVKGNDKTGLFDPSKSVLKNELLKMGLLANSLSVDSILKELPGENIGSEVPQSAWFYSYVLFAKEYGIIYPTSNGKLEPGKELTRGEVAEVLYNIAKITKGGPTQEMLSRTEAKIFSAITKINAADYDSAVSEIKKGQTYAERALLLSPSETIVQEAQAITTGYSLTIQGFSLWKKDKNPTAAKQKALDAEKIIEPVSHLGELKKSLEALIALVKAAK